MVSATRSNRVPGVFVVEQRRVEGEVGQRTIEAVVVDGEAHCTKLSGAQITDLQSTGKQQ